VHLGLSLDDFDRLTIPEFFDAVKVRRDMDNMSLQQTRMVMYAAMLPHYKKLNITDILPLPGDKPASARRVLTAEEEELQLSTIARMDAEAKADHLKSNAKI